MTMNIFVYGTLRKGQYAHRLMDGAKFLGEAVTATKYQLYDVGSFPGLIEDPSIEGGVSGELYEITEDMLPRIDHYEGVAHGLFRRGEVVLSDGSTANAYFFNRSIDQAIRIESGVWHRK